MNFRQSLVLLVSFCACLPLYAQNNQKPKVGAITPKYESIELGSVELYLGEPKADVLARLVTAGYTTHPMGGDANSFSVLGQKPDKTWALLGTFGFTAGRLTFVSKHWTPAVKSDYDLAKAIFFATKNMNDRGCRLVTLDPKENDQPGVQVRAMSLSCVGSHRSFEITTFDTDPGSMPPGTPEKSVVLSETLADQNQSAAR